MLGDRSSWEERDEELYARLSDLDTLLFSEYVPTKGKQPFKSRLKEWLSGLSGDADRRLLLSLLDHLYFIGQAELDVLYRKAFRGDIMWWLAPSTVTFEDLEFESELEQALESTWFCPITDSMNIAHFHHVNGIRDRNLRPEWRALAKFADPETVRAYIELKGFQRLVLLEDFVGTGNQARGTIEWTRTHFPDLPLLLCPLVICQPGLKALGDLLAGQSPSEIRPGVVVPDCCAVGMPPGDDEPPSFPALRELLLRLVGVVGAPGASPEEEAFGFGLIGALTVLLTNCPNNVPPALHYADTDGWAPLFPRSVRV